MTTWHDVIPAMEDEVDRHEEALRTGNLTVVPAFEPPEGLGPLPPLLADRVRHLIERTNLLATFVQYHLVATDNDIKHAERGALPKNAIALYLDASA